MSLLQAEIETISRGKGEFSIVAYRSIRRPALNLVKELLSLGYGVRFRANGKSMHPTIREREIITVNPVNSSDLMLGDIVLYQKDGGLVAHRVLRTGRGNRNTVFFLTRGDSSGSCDAPVESRQILGKVVSVNRDGRRIHLDSRRSKMLHTARVGVRLLKRKVYRGMRAAWFDTAERS